MAGEFHNPSFSAHSGRANIHLRDGKRVSLWLPEVEDFDEDAAAILPSDTSSDGVDDGCDEVWDDYLLTLSKEEAMENRLSRYSSDDHVYRDPSQRNFNGGFVFDDDDSVFIQTERNAERLDRCSFTALADFKFRALQDKSTEGKTVLPMQPRVARYQGHTEIYHPDGIQFDFDPVELDYTDPENEEEGITDPLWLDSDPETHISVDEHKSSMRAKKICNVKGHSFKCDYSVYCDNCGDNLDGRRKYNCVADGCGTMFCVKCASQNAKDDMNVQFGN